MNEIEDVPQCPEGWEDGITSDEFLEEIKTMLLKKFDEKNGIVYYQ